LSIKVLASKEHPVMRAWKWQREEVARAVGREANSMFPLYK